MASGAPISARKARSTTIPASRCFGSASSSYLAALRDRRPGHPGSSIGDNQRVDAPRGTVRAFDVRTGAPRWRWDPVPERADDPDAASWGDGWRTAGAANVWAPIAIDEARGLGFLRAKSPSIGGQGCREFSPDGQRSSQRQQDCAIG